MKTICNQTTQRASDRSYKWEVLFRCMTMNRCQRYKPLNLAEV
jgi:hypothetical protein